MQNLCCRQHGLDRKYIFIIDLLSAERPWQTGKAIVIHRSEIFIPPGTGALLPHPLDAPEEESSWKASATYARIPTSIISDAEDIASVSSGTVFSAEDISSQPDHPNDEYCDEPVDVLSDSSYEWCQGGRIEPCDAPAYLTSDIIVEVPRAKIQPSTNPQWREVDQMTSDSIRFSVLVDTCKGTRSSRSEEVGSNAEDVFSTRSTRAELEKVIAESIECQFDSLMKRDFHQVDGGPSAADPSCTSPQPSRQSEGISAEPPRDQARGSQNNDDDEENDGNNNRGPNRVELLETKDHITCRLACPFYKHDPSKCMNFRPCAGPGWKSITRLKSVIMILQPGHN